MIAFSFMKFMAFLSSILFQAWIAAQYDLLLAFWKIFTVTCVDGKDGRVILSIYRQDITNNLDRKSRQIK